MTNYVSFFPMRQTICQEHWLEAREALLIQAS